LSFIFILRRALRRESNLSDRVLTVSYPTMHDGRRRLNHGVPTITGERDRSFRADLRRRGGDHAGRGGRRVVRAKARRREDVSSAAAVCVSNILSIDVARAFDARRRTFAPSRLRVNNASPS
jgi:hypothetical protein